MTNGLGIEVSITAGKALVGIVKEAQVAFLFHDIANLRPFFKSRISASWVMRTGMKDNNTLIWHVLNVIDCLLDVNLLDFLIVVGIFLEFKPCIVCDVFMVTPCWRWDVNRLVSLPKPVQELHSKTK